MGNARNYLIFEDVRKDASLKPVFNACVAAVADGSAQLSKTRAAAGYPSYPCFLVNGKELIADSVLEYYLSGLCQSEFDYEAARDFAEKMLGLCGWNDIYYVLSLWAERVVRDPFFYAVKDEDGYDEWRLKPGEPSWQLSEAYLQFACWIAVSEVKYGRGYFTKEIFAQVSALGSDLPAKLKRRGSGALPLELAEYKDAALSCKANDVFATVRITLKEESRESYQKVLDYLRRLLETDFPKSYAVDFKSSEKKFLPIPRLPKKGIHQLFANAAQWRDLYERIERYARLAMREFEWYTNLQDEYCAMPGTFAVFALGLADEKYHELVCDYLQLCDGEHQGVHGEFVLAYIEKYGFTQKGLELYKLCEENIQRLPKKLESLYIKRQIRN
ncbi:MAG: DUF6138 family protein [Helicobacteraceae bacterium]|jgi:hypothetical protein|nr:DUF6138 family protein [Helicobacteraceae bacterium]